MKFAGAGKNVYRAGKNICCAGKSVYRAGKNVCCAGKSVYRAGKKFASVHFKSCWYVYIFIFYAKKIAVIMQKIVVGVYLI